MSTCPICETCGAPLPAAGAACDRCLMRRALELPDSAPLGPGFLDDLPMAEEAEATVGKYTILGTVARGGMGVVYRARQAELNRTVALKMLLGGTHASDGFKKRFVQEAQAAARLSHPAIVKILDWGEDQGQPFFAMEFIEGADLGDKTRGQPLAARRAAEMVLTLAGAIEYAHGQGVLHRDLKPSNVLLDAQGAPRITDFGLARQIDQESSLTATGDMIGTPGYVPPEQASSRFGKIGVWSDVYGLGGILYCLLTGRPPFVAANATEVLRAVAEQEPPSPRQLNASVPADLETICLKCLEKDSARRYASAQALADDLRNFLNGDPIQARPASRIYKARKWVEKNRFPAAFAAVAVLALLIGSAVAWMQAIRAGQAKVVAQNHERLARAESAKSRQTTAFLKELLSGVTIDQTLGRDTRLLKEMVAVAAGRADNTLTNQPEVEAEVREILARTSRQLAMFAEAYRHAERALRLREELSGPGHPDLIPPLQEMAQAASDLGRTAQAEELWQRVLVLAGDRWRAEDPARLRVLRALAGVESARGHHTNAIARLESVLEIQTRTLGPAAEDTLRTQRSMADVYVVQGRYREAERVRARVLEICRRHFPGDSAAKFEAGAELASVKLELGEYATAALLYQSVIDYQQRVLGRDHPHTLRTLSELAATTGRAGHRADADQMLREALAGLQKHAGDTHPDTLAALGNLAGELIDQARHAEAEPIVTRVVESFTQVRGPDHPYTLASRIDLARVNRGTGRTNEAAAMFRDIAGRARRSLGTNHICLANALLHLAVVEGELQHWPESERAGRDSMEIWTNLRGPGDREALRAGYQVAVSLGRQQQATDAEAWHKRVLADRERSLGPTHPDTLESLQAVIKVTGTAGRTDEARAFLGQLEERRRRVEGAGPTLADAYTSPTMSYTKADAYFREGKFAEAESIFRKLYQGKLKRGETNGETTVVLAASLGRCLAEWAWAEPAASNALARATEGEQILRWCSALREGGVNNPQWRLFDTRSRHGFALAVVAFRSPDLASETRPARLAEAERLMLEASAALDADNAVAILYRRDAMTRLVRLYESWPKPDKAALWKARIEVANAATAPKPN